MERHESGLVTTDGYDTDIIAPSSSSSDDSEPNDEHAVVASADVVLKHNKGEKVTHMGVPKPVEEKYSLKKPQQQCKQQTMPKSSTLNQQQQQPPSCRSSRRQLFPPTQQPFELPRIPPPKLKTGEKKAELFDDLMDQMCSEPPRPPPPLLDISKIETTFASPYDNNSHCHHHSSIPVAALQHTNICPFCAECKLRVKKLAVSMNDKLSCLPMSISPDMQSILESQLIQENSCLLQRVDNYFSNIALQAKNHKLTTEKIEGINASTRLLLHHFRAIHRELNMLCEQSTYECKYSENVKTILTCNEYSANERMSGSSSPARIDLPSPALFKRSNSERKLYKRRNSTKRESFPSNADITTTNVVTVPLHSLSVYGWKIVLFLCLIVVGVSLANWLFDTRRHI